MILRGLASKVVQRNGRSLSIPEGVELPRVLDEHLQERKTLFSIDLHAGWMSGVVPRNAQEFRHRMNSQFEAVSNLLSVNGPCEIASSAETR
jgi:hypothetical protein